MHILPASYSLPRKGQFPLRNIKTHRTQREASIFIFFDITRVINHLNEHTRIPDDLYISSSSLMPDVFLPLKTSGCYFVLGWKFAQSWRKRKIPFPYEQCRTRHVAFVGRKGSASFIIWRTVYAGVIYPVIFILLVIPAPTEHPLGSWYPTVCLPSRTAF